MKLSISDRVVIAGGLAVIVVFSALFYRDLTKRLDSGERELIGTISFKRKVAQRKYSSQVVWEDAFQNMPVYNYDTLRTAEMSEAMIRLKDGTEIALNENSMILFAISKDEVDIKFQQGSISAKRADVGGKDLKKLNILAAGSTVSVGKGDVTLAQGRGKELNMTVNKGQASLKSGDASQNVSADQAIVASKDGLKLYELSLKLSEPENGRIVLSRAAAPAVRFSWIPVKKGFDVFLEVSANQGFTGAVTRRRVKGSAEALKVPRGVSFWRLRAVEKGTGRVEYSETRRLSVISDRPVNLISPQNGAVITYKAKNPVIGFSWSENDIGNGYNLVVAADPGFKKVVHSVQVGQGRISVDRLGEGTYYWKVSNVLGLKEAGSGGESRVQSFSIKKRSEMATPQLAYPVDGKKINRSVLSKKGISLSWQENQEYSSVRVIVARDPDMKSIVFEGSSRLNYVRFAKDLPEGEYYWRAQGFSDSGEGTAPSQSRSLAVTSEGTIALIEPRNNAALAPDEGDAAVSFSWRGESGRYLLQVAKDTSFKSLYKYATVNDLTGTLSPFESGRYYWRVKLLDDRNQEVMKSDTGIFTIGEELNRPLPITPSPGSSINMLNKESLTFSWKPVKGAQGYRFNLYQVKGKVQSSVLSVETGKTSYTISNLKKLDVGPFVWTVQAVPSGDKAEGRKGQMSSVRFSINLGKKTKIKIHNPKMLYIE